MRKSSHSAYMLGFFLSSLLYNIEPVCAQAVASGASERITPLNAFHTATTHTSFTGADTSGPSGKRPLLDVLIELNKAKGVYFLFSQQPLGKVLVNSPSLLSDLPVEKILSQVLKNTGLIFKKVDERTFVILNRKSPVRNNSYDLPLLQDSLGNSPDADTTMIAPSRTISGKVAAGDGKALQGVSVTVKNTRKGVATDLEGLFNIDAAKDDTLIFSFVGYKTRKMVAAKAGRGWVVMEPSDQPLTEVMVTALGISRQERSLGYSTSALDGSRFTESRDVNLGNALVGQIAGVSVALNATGPYGSSRVLIR